MSAVFSWASIGWITFTASMAGMTLGTVRFLFPNVLSEPPTRFKAGSPISTNRTRSATGSNPTGPG